METLAAIAFGADAPFEITTMEIDDPRDEEILVRIVAVGLCHTDITTKSLFPDGEAVVLGHEGAGIVERVGSAVDDVKPGNRVLLTFTSCGECGQCLQGNTTYCAQFPVLNAPGARADGSATLTKGGQPVLGSFFGQSSFSNYALTRRQNIVVVEDSTDLVMSAPFGCGFQTGAGVVVNVFNPRTDASIVVYGVGGVGMAAVMAAKALGVQTIIAVDVTAARRSTAEMLGATHTIDGAAGDVTEKIKVLTGGGANYALDTTGIGSVITEAAKALGPLGTLVVVGMGSPEIKLDAADLIAGGKSVRGCIEGDSDPQTMVPLMTKWHKEGKFPVEKIISEYPFSAINTAVEDTISGKAIKPVLAF